MQFHPYQAASKFISAALVYHIVFIMSGFATCVELQSAYM